MHLADKCPLAILCFQACADLLHGQLQYIDAVLALGVQLIFEGGSLVPGTDVKQHHPLLRFGN